MKLNVTGKQVMFHLTLKKHLNLKLIVKAAQHVTVQKMVKIVNGKVNQIQLIQHLQIEHLKIVLQLASVHQMEQYVNGRTLLQQTSLQKLVTHMKIVKVRLQH